MPTSRYSNLPRENTIPPSTKPKKTGRAPTPPRGAPVVQPKASGNKLPGDQLQAKSNQNLKIRTSATQIYKVEDVALQSHLENPGAARVGAYRLFIPLPGAVTNDATGSTVFVDQRGQYRYIKRCSMIVENLFGNDIEVRVNTPYSYTLGGSATNARSNIRHHILKPNQKIRIRAKLTLNNNQTFPPVQTLTLNCRMGETTGDVTLRSLAAFDFVIIIPDTPDDKGISVSSKDGQVSSTQNEWSKSATVCAVAVDCKMDVQSTSDVSLGSEAVAKMFTSPSLAFAELPSLAQFLDIEPMQYIPSVTAVQHHVAMIKGPANKTGLFAVSPSYVSCASEGNHNFIRVMDVEYGQKKGWALMICDGDGKERTPVSLKALQDEDVRIVGPGIIQAVKDDDYIAAVYNEYKYDRAAGMWMLTDGDKIKVIDFWQDLISSAQYDKTVPLMYYNISSKNLKSKSVKIHQLDGFINDVVGVLEGAIQIIGFVAEVGAIFGL